MQASVFLLCNQICYQSTKSFLVYFSLLSQFERSLLILLMNGLKGFQFIKQKEKLIILIQNDQNEYYTQKGFIKGQVKLKDNIVMHQKLNIKNECIIKKSTSQFVNKFSSMGSCFYAEKLQKYKSLYPVSTKLPFGDPRLNDPQFLRGQIDRLDYIIQHQNLNLAKLQQQNEKLSKHVRNKKVMNNSKKLFLMTKNGYLCKSCFDQNDTNKLSVAQLVNLEGICAKCKGEGLLRDFVHVRSLQCGKCDRYFQYLWRIEICGVCNGAGILYIQGVNPYESHDRGGTGSNKEFVKES